MKIDAITKSIYSYIKEEINYSKDFDPETNIIEEGIIDSMGVLALVSFLETKYGIEIELEEITVENFASVRLIAEFVKKLGR